MTAMEQKKTTPKPTKAQYRAAIKVARGILRPKLGEVSMTQNRVVLKAEERALEARRDAVLADIGRRKSSPTI